MKAAPKKGKGERALDCPNYESCLDFAAIQNWHAFSCESCGCYVDSLKKPSPSPEKKENTRICEKCGNNPTIQPNSPLCASCIGKQAWKGGKAKKKGPSNKKAPGSLKRKETTQGKGKHKAEKVQQRGNMEIVFKGKYNKLLEEVEKLAEEEIRTVDEQIVYILKNYLSNTQHPGVIK